MGKEDLKKKLRLAASKDDLDDMMVLLKDSLDVIDDEFGLELLETSVSQRKCNHYRCAVYLIKQNIDPARLTEISLIYGISPLHSIAIALRDVTHLTDKEQCEILNAIITYEINHGCSPMMTLKMSVLSESTPFDILNLRQKNYYTQTKQKLLETLPREIDPLRPSQSLNNRATPNALSDLTRYLFSFMYNGNNVENANQNMHGTEMKEKTLKCE